MLTIRKQLDFSSLPVQQLETIKRSYQFIVASSLLTSVVIGLWFHLEWVWMFVGIWAMFFAVILDAVQRIREINGVILRR